MLHTLSSSDDGGISDFLGDIFYQIASFSQNAFHSLALFILRFFSKLLADGFDPIGLFFSHFKVFLQSAAELVRLACFDHFGQSLDDLLLSAVKVL